MLSPKYISSSSAASRPWKVARHVSEQSHTPSNSVCDPSHSDSSATTLVNFRVKIETQFQEKVRVVGSCRELGCWDTLVAPELTTRPDIYPFWCTTKPIALPLRRLIEYKYVLLDKDNVFSRWEPHEGNRTLTPNGVSMLVEDDEGAGRNLPCVITSSPSVGDRLRSLSAPLLPLGSETEGMTFYHNDSYEVGQSESGECTESHHVRDDSPIRRGVREVGSNRRRGRAGITTETIKKLQESDFNSPSIDENDMLIIASFELPLKIVRATDGSLSIAKQKSLVMPLLHGLRHRVRVPMKCVGWPGIVAQSDAERAEIEGLLESQDCIPVFLSQEQLDLFFAFCHRTLWPLFHNVVVLDTYTNQPFSETQWQCYQQINRLYADVIVHHAHESDLIWVQDYHLLLCPQFVTRRIRKANIGLFLHIPFPSSEVFRCLPVREEILRGMLCADLIGFHFFEYARHFLVVNKRLLGLEHHFRIGGFLELDYGGRNVILRIGHVHVQYDDLRRSIEESKEIVQIREQLKNRYASRFVFVSIDRCDRLAGILLKLRGFQHFLRNYEYARDTATLIQRCYPTADEWENQQQDCIYELRSLTDEINQEFSTASGHSAPHHHVVLDIGSINAVEKYALFQAGDCLLDTSVRDGLNLNSFEYICCRRDDPAPLILSEFTGCCRTVASAMRVNPWKIEDISKALDVAMNTSREDMRDRFLRDQIYLERNSTLQWADEFLLDLRRARKKEDLVYVSWGFGTNYRVVGLDSHFQHLNVEWAIQSYRKSSRSVFFFDHEGTLAPDRRPITAVPGYEALSSTGSGPSTLIQECLTSLCAAGNIVIILSGRDRNLLDDWFGSIPGIGLCAEHGFYFKVPTINGNDWQCVSDCMEDFTWKDIAIGLMTQYVKRTQGAFIENKGSALVFQYRDADPDFGSWQAKELSNYLEEILFGLPVSVMSGKGYVEVKLSGVSKGKAVELLLKGIQDKDPNQPPLDFILCIGDDRSDEEMFPVVNQLFSPLTPSTRLLGDGFTPRSSIETVSAPSANRFEESMTLEDRHSQTPFESKSCRINSRTCSSREPRLQQIVSSGGLGSARRADTVRLPAAFTVTVGKKPSNARYYLNDVEEVSELLLALRSHCDKLNCPNGAFKKLSL